MKTFKQFLTEAKQSLNEAFITDEKEIMKWLREYDKNYNKNKYTIKNGVVDVEGNVDLSKKPAKYFPFQFGIVKGYFDCKLNKLTSLKGAPRWIKDYFDCSDNNLTTLKDGPEGVGGIFICSNNKLTSLEGAPKEVESCYCSYNKLTSLKGASKKVWENFDCSHNNLTSLEGAPEEVWESFDCSYNKLTSLKGAPKESGERFDCSNNNLTSLEGAPEVWIFDCTNNPKLKSLDGIDKEEGKIIYSDIKESINESDIITNYKEKVKDKLLPQNEIKKFYDAWNDIFDLTEYVYEVSETLYDDIAKGKLKNASYFKDYDDKLKYVADTIKKYPYGTSYSNSELIKLTREYERIKNNYITDAKCFNLVKIGEKEDVAVKKLSKGLNDKEISKRFDPYTEEEIYDEINNFHGNLRIRGGADLYIDFKDGKVKNKYF